MMTQNYPVKISVAMTTYNHEKYLAEALESILRQRHSYTLEIVISDDCSTDGTQIIILDYYKKYPQIIRPILHKKNLGVAKNCLHNFRSCKGEYIATMDGDDFWTDELKLQKQISFLDNHPEYVLSCHRFKQFYQESGRMTLDFHPELFEDKPDGFDFGQELYFEKWLTQTLTVVFRNKALENTPELENYRYCWDLEIFWTVLNKGRAYAHNFFGAIYRIHNEGHWNGNNVIKKNLQNYLNVEELLRQTPNHPHLKRYYHILKENLRWSQPENKRKINPDQLFNRDFTIVSDDGWGEEVYKAFDLPLKTPFVGIKIFNADFVQLTSDFRFYMNQKLVFHPIENSIHSANYDLKFGQYYPMAKLNNEIELHFVDFDSQEEAEESWNRRLDDIVWNNLFFKMDVTHEENNVSLTEFFLSENEDNKVAFLSKLHSKKFKLKNQPDNLIILDLWSPAGEILFPFSLDAFDLVGWLNKEAWRDDNRSKGLNFFIPWKPQNHFFIELEKEEINAFDNNYYPEAFQISYLESINSLEVKYKNPGKEYFQLQVKSSKRDANQIFIDLSEKDSRHVLVLAKGNIGHRLGIKMATRSSMDAWDYVFEASGMEQELTEEFQWIHFDFSNIPVEDDNVKRLAFVKSFHFYIQANSSGRLEMLAFYAGSLIKFNEIIGIESETLYQ